MIYADDDPIWQAEPSIEDCIELITAVMMQAIQEELKTPQGNMAFNGVETITHDRYLFSDWGLKYDCELLDINYSKIKSGILNCRKARQCHLVTR